jgi:hypothetical protein
VNNFVAALNPVLGIVKKCDAFVGCGEDKFNLLRGEADVAQQDSDFVLLWVRPWRFGLLSPAAEEKENRWYHPSKDYCIAKSYISHSALLLPNKRFSFE